jgi:hypothetical protein
LQFGRVESGFACLDCAELTSPKTPSAAPAGAMCVTQLHESAGAVVPINNWLMSLACSVVEDLLWNVSECSVLATFFFALQKQLCVHTELHGDHGHNFLHDVF